MLSDLLKRYKTDIKRSAQRHKIRSVSVFGSFARGEEREDSDIDLLVESEADCSLFDVISMKYEIEDLTGHTVDVVTINGLSPYLSEQIIKEAIPI